MEVSWNINLEARLHQDCSMVCYCQVCKLCLHCPSCVENVKCRSIRNAYMTQIPSTFIMQMKFCRIMLVMLVMPWQKARVCVTYTFFKHSHFELICLERIICQSIQNTHMIKIHAIFYHADEILQDSVAQQSDDTTESEGRCKHSLWPIDVHNIVFLEYPTLFVLRIYKNVLVITSIFVWNTLNIITDVYLFRLMDGRWWRHSIAPLNWYHINGRR